MTYGYGGLPTLLKKYTKSEALFWCPIEKDSSPFREFPSEWDRQKNWASVMYRWSLIHFTNKYENPDNKGQILKDAQFARPGKTVALHEIKSYHCQHWTIC
jgi:hypothetical protein